MEKFRFQKQVGEGGFASVYLAINDAGQSFAVKRIPRTEQNFMSRIREVAANSRLHHPNVATFYDHYEDKAFCYLVFEFVCGVDLFGWLDKNRFAPTPESIAQVLFRQIANAIKYIHKTGVFHRDLKLENILILPSGKIKLIDFGLCALSEHGPTFSDSVGSSDYAAPEVLLKKEYDPALIDVFSTGVIFYCVLTGELPFDTEDRTQFYHRKREHPEVDFRYANISMPAKELVTGMLTVDPKKRLTIKDVCEHRWLKTKDTKKEVLNLF